MRGRSTRTDQEDARVSFRSIDPESPIESHPREIAAPAPGSPIAPFLLGTVVGGIAGALLGTALSPHTRGYLVGLYHLVNRRLSSAERDQLRFELLLQ
jgi:hypothetical protein